jgi:hypothetical protein
MTGTGWAALGVAIGIPTIGVVYAAGRLSRAVDDLSSRVASIERVLHEPRRRG